jgi:hypothetical protein
VGARSSAQLDDLARAVADGVPRRVVVGRIAAFMAAFLVGDTELALGARKKCRKGRRRCGDICCKPGYVCRTKKHRKRCVCPKPGKVCGDLRAWEADVPGLVLVSTGTEEENRAMGLRAPIVLDPGFAIAPAYGVSGTPSAVLLDASGRVAAEPAVGAPAVLALAR